VERCGLVDFFESGNVSSVSMKGRKFLTESLLVSQGLCFMELFSYWTISRLGVLNIKVREVRIKC